MSERSPSVSHRLIDFLHYLIDFLKLCVDDKQKTINLVAIASVFTVSAICFYLVAGA